MGLSFGAWALADQAEGSTSIVYELRLDVENHQRTDVLQVRSAVPRVRYIVKVALAWLDIFSSCVGATWRWDLEAQLRAIVVA